MSIRLVIIARDEAARIPALADATSGLIESAHVLIDDRTTDATAAACEHAWGSLPGGVITELGEFADFAQFRNHSLTRGRVGLADDDYLLLLDPDSLPAGELPSDAELTEGAYTCEWRYYDAIWRRVILLRADTRAAYEGAVHETLSTPGTLQAHLSDVWVDAVVSADADRLGFIESVLRRDAATSPRSAFYLAQTLRDQGRRDEAFGWYMRRAAMGDGWAEETYCATLEAGLLLAVYDYDLAAVLWRRCIGIRGRSEAPYQLAKQANDRGNHSEALSWASLGLQIGPTTDALFVNRWIESEGLMIEFNRAAQALMPHGSEVSIGG